ncbi:transposase [uncultured Oceanisphaera sp.]|uniref:transposase n=1 Tax=uncultured Oceanisphaera sp. TaxID=353858 RepID=UPI00345BCE22
MFECNDDRYRFLAGFDDVCETFHWVCHAYCLMGNHYHLLIKTPEGNLSRGMRQLNGVYTQAFNRKHKRTGHLLQGRYNEKSGKVTLPASRFQLLASGFQLKCAA